MRSLFPITLCDLVDFSTIQIIRVDKVELAYDLDVKILLLKAHYQLDKEYDERTMQIFRSVERFVRGNQTLSTFAKKSYKNLIQIIINLYRVKHRVGKRTLEQIRQKMEKMNFIGDKKWLLEKIEEIT